MESYKIPEDCIDKIENADNMENKLKILFSAWEGHQIEDDYYCKTAPKKSKKCDKRYDEDFKKSFYPDGCVDYIKYANAKTKILFLLKEPGDICERGEIGYNNDDYFYNHW